MAKSKYAEHWPIITVVILVAIVFIISLVTFQVENSEHAIVLRFGKPTRHAEPGLHFKAPWPVEKVWTRTKRIQYFEGVTGRIEEVQTKDRKNINVTTYVLFRIDQTPESVETFMQKLGTMEQARQQLTGLMRSHRAAVIGQYDFADMVTTELDADGNPAVKLGEIEQTILSRLQKDALELYGIEVTALKFKHIGLPETVTQRVFERMRADRERESKRIAAEGKALAEQISRKADTEYNAIVQKASAEAKQIKADGDAQAANVYSAFNENPELAEFFLKLESIDRITGAAANGEAKDPMVMIVDPTLPPFDVLRPGVLEEMRAANAAAAEKSND